MASVAGVLAVTVECAKDVKENDNLFDEWFFRPDPFCSIHIGQQLQRTRTATGAGHHPVWNETFHFTLGADDLEVEVEVMDSQILRDESLGFAAFSLAQVRADGSQRLELPLASRKDPHHQQGTLSLALRWCPNYDTTADINTCHHTAITPAAPRAEPAGRGNVAGNADAAGGGGSNSGSSNGSGNSSPLAPITAALANRSSPMPIPRASSPAGVPLPSSAAGGSAHGGMVLGCSAGAPSPYVAFRSVPASPRSPCHHHFVADEPYPAPYVVQRLSHHHHHQHRQLNDSMRREEFVVLEEREDDVVEAAAAAVAAAEVVV